MDYQSNLMEATVMDKLTTATNIALTLTEMSKMDYSLMVHSWVDHRSTTKSNLKTSFLQ